jgi:hypothetical protein
MSTNRSLEEKLSVLIAPAIFPAVKVAQATFGVFVGAVKDPSGSVVAGLHGCRP